MAGVNVAGAIVTVQSGACWAIIPAQKEPKVPGWSPLGKRHIWSLLKGNSSIKGGPRARMWSLLEGKGTTRAPQGDQLKPVGGTNRPKSLVRA